MRPAPTRISFAPLPASYPMATTIDLTAGLRGLPGVSATPLPIDLDPRRLARTLAEAVAAQVRAELDRGCDPTGRPLEPLAPSTLAQHRREGAPAHRGVVTGRLRDSLQARPDGDGYTIEPSADRAEASGHVYVGATIWDERASEQTGVRRAMQQAADDTTKPRR